MAGQGLRVLSFASQGCQSPRPPELQCIRSHACAVTHELILCGSCNGQKFSQISPTHLILGGKPGCVTGQALATAVIQEEGKKGPQSEMEGKVWQDSRPPEHFMKESLKKAL